MKAVPLILAAALAAGCVSMGSALRPGVSTEADIRRDMGMPAVEFANTDGSRDLFYPRGPLGTQTLRAHVDAQGRLQAVRAVLNDDTFFHVQPGMTREEVLRLIGPPGDRMAFSRSRTYAWDYRFQDTWGYLAIFSVTFDERDIVVSKITRRIDRDRGRG